MSAQIAVGQTLCRSAFGVRASGAVRARGASAHPGAQTAASRPNPLSLINIAPLMEGASGRPEVTIGLVDGPVALRHPDLASARLREIPGSEGACRSASSSACRHGTFVAGILVAKRGSPAPAICPGCTLLIRPVFAEALSGRDRAPSATPDALAAAIVECIEAGARVINLSLGLEQASGKDERTLEQALDQAVRRGVIIVAASGNQRAVGSSVLTRHPWVIPVVGFDLTGRPTSESNLGGSIGRRGVGAPGDRVTSLGAEGEPITLGGTSVATPFVTGAIALLWSEFPSASPADVKLAISRASASPRASVIPPLLDVAAARRNLSENNRGV